MEITITLPETFVANCRGVGKVVKLAELPESIVAQCVLYGLGQKLADSASGAATIVAKDKFGDEVDMRDPMIKAWIKGDGAQDVRNETDGAMTQSLDALLRGDWTSRAASVSRDPEIVALLRLVASSIKGENDKAKTKAWNALSTSEQIAIANDNRGNFEAEIPAEIDRMEKIAEAKREENERNAKLSAKVSIKL